MPYDHFLPARGRGWRSVWCGWPALDSAREPKQSAAKARADANHLWHGGHKTGRHLGTGADPVQASAPL